MRADLGRVGRFLTLLIALAAALFSGVAAAENDDSSAAAEGEQAEGEQDGEEAEGDEGSDGEASGGEKAEGGSPFDDIMRSNAPAPRPEKAEGAGAGEEAARGDEGATVEVSLAEYARLSERVAALRRAPAGDAGPRVVLGGASYEGEVARGVLALRMKLLVTLAGDGVKTVPLVGDDVALVSASADGEPIGLTRRPGYHVWVTDRRGAAAIEVSMLVAPRGPRGSIEYAFRSARTPSTSLEVRLPTEGLAPRFDGAVVSDVRASRGGTTARATLEPTTEIRMVGFRDLGREEGQSARVYAETSTLLSIDEPSIELFTVARYSILYAATQSFEVLVPEGLDVVSADGEGAFRYEIERRDGGSVLRGETAFPVQGSYELSIRLRRSARAAPLGASAGARDALDVALPRCLGVEREHGWLAVEVPGKLRIEEASRRDLIGVDARQLPSEVAGSAVSPILKAYRYHRAAPALGLWATRLPEEEELADGAIDRIDAVSVLSPEGKLLTELRITLRNTLRPSLALALPAATTVRAALLDGEPVRPSRSERGELLLPLKRSRGEERLEPFALEVVLESERAPLGILGWSGIELPAVDLTAAALRWHLHLPASNQYGDLRAAIREQTFAGAASWHKPPHLTRAVRWDEAEGGAEGEGGADRRPAAPAAAPVRLELPRTGVELAHARYWVSSGEAVRVEVPYARAWLLLPLKLLLAVLLAAGVGAASRAAGAMRVASVAARAVACAALALALYKLGGSLHLGGGLLAGIALRAERRLSRERIAGALRAYAASLPRRLGAWRRRQIWSRRRAARALALAAGAAAVGWMLADGVGRIAKALAALAGFTA